MKTDYTREELIQICEQAIVPEEKWGNRDSPDSMDQLGRCAVFLKCGCEFWIHPPAKESGCHMDERTIWLSIDHKTFNTFEYGGGYTESESYWLPTPQRLADAEGDDWY